MNDYKYKASIVLALTTVLFFISYPFSHTFWGGLAASAFSAAMIGGLADWFAVSALFRRPLMIPFRTAVIPNNRERIFASIVNMVEKELLTSQNIKQTLTKAGLAQEVLENISRPQSRSRLKKIVSKTTKEWLERLTPSQVGEFLAGVLREHLGTAKLSPFIGQALSWSIKKGYVDLLLDLLLSECQKLAQKDYIKNVFINVYNKTEETYTSDLFRRKILVIVMEEFLKLTPEKVAELAQERLAAYLSEMKENSGKNKQLRRIKAFLIKLALNLKENPQYSEKVEEWKQNFLASPLLATFLAELFSVFRQMLDSKQSEAKINKLDSFLAKAGHELEAALAGNKQLRDKLDEILINSLSKLVNKHHNHIGKIVSGYLSGWSNEELVDYIESRAGNDLQMIRINGSIIGGATGMALYLVVLFIERLALI